jgi:hypothetical protein
LWKAIISFLMSVCLSVCLSNCLYICPSVLPSVRPHGSTRLPLDGFSWKFIFEYFQVFCRENSSSLTSHKKSGYFTWRPMYIFIISHSVFLRMKNVSDKTVKKMKIKFYVQYLFLKKSCPLWYNVEKYGRARRSKYDDIIWRMRFACWLTKTKNTLSQVITFAFPQQQCFLGRLSMLRCRYISCLVQNHLLKRVHQNKKALLLLQEPSAMENFKYLNISHMLVMAIQYSKHTRPFLQQHRQITW